MAAKPDNSACAESLPCAEINRRVSVKLRRRRRQLKLRQENVGDICGVGFQQIQDYEAGTQGIAAEQLWRIAHALGVPLSWFYDDLPWPPSPKA